MWARDILIIVLGTGGVFGTFGGRAVTTSSPTVDLTPITVRLDKVETAVTAHTSDRTFHLSSADIAAQTSHLSSETESLKAGLAAQQRQLDRIEQAIIQLANRELRKAQ